MQDWQVKIEDVLKMKKDTIEAHFHLNYDPNFVIFYYLESL